MRRSSRARADHDMCIGRRKIRGIPTDAPLLADSRSREVHDRSRRRCCRDRLRGRRCREARAAVAGCPELPDGGTQSIVWPGGRLAFLEGERRGWTVGGRLHGPQRSRGSGADRPVDEDQAQRPLAATSPEWSTRTSCSGYTPSARPGRGAACDEAPAERSARPAAARGWRSAAAVLERLVLRTASRPCGSARRDRHGQELRRSWCVLRR